METVSEPALLVSIKNITVQLGAECILNDISMLMHTHEQWAIIGRSGSGKTTLAHVFVGKVFYRGELCWRFLAERKDRIELVEQQHRFKNLSNTSSFYYQQRFNASEAEDSATVAGMLEMTQGDNHWIGKLHLTGLLEKPLLQLSNGENKRLQLAIALQHHPTVLILDNPFIGLDAEGRETLHRILDEISLQGIQLVLITGPAELPACITHVAVLDQGKIISTQTREKYLQHHYHHEQPLLDESLLQQLHQPAGNHFQLAVKMEDVTIRYGEKIILDGINWTVKKGECWNVSGPNGAGKSTLLSLITADNPQAYANKIILFDKARGTGESIWDIKRKIGFVSPELHLYFEQHTSCFEVIASGLFDTIGLFRKLNAEQEELVLLWMQLMSLLAFRDKRIYQLSASQQRMALLARALIKNPPLLILDEPTQGLDETQTLYFKQLVTSICGLFQSTLIYVSHYPSDLPGCINQFLRLENGRAIN